MQIVLNHSFLKHFHLTSHQPICVLKQCIETTAILVHQTNPFFGGNPFLRVKTLYIYIYNTKFGSNPFYRLGNLNIRDLKIEVFQHFCQTANIKKS